jgi:1-acyl-sn-glycerol-3-phosphate acyltransferase
VWGYDKGHKAMNKKIPKPRFIDGGTSGLYRFHAIVWGMFFLKAAQFLIVTVTLAPFYFLILLVLYPWRLRIGPRLVQFYSKICLLIYRVRIDRVKHFRAFKKKKKGLLIIANHGSFLDIFVLSALFGTSFVSKAEVKYYPIIGQIARLMGVIFFERTSRAERIRVLRTVASCCRERIIAVFPQGTTGRISERLPFSRGIFKVLDINPEITLLPVTLHYKEDAEIAWNAPQSLRENATRVSGQQSIRVKVSIHHPVARREHEGKTTAEICRMVEETVLGDLEKGYPEA